MHPEQGYASYDEFAQQELQPTMEDVNGPVDSFVLEKVRKSTYLEQAIETGSLEGMEFDDCPPFDDLEQKRIRQEAKRAQEVLGILAEEGGPAATEQEVVRGYAAQEVWRGVLVEASRRSALAARGQSNDDPDFCRDMVRRAQQELYPIPERQLALESLSMLTPYLDRVQADDASEEVRSMAERIRADYPETEEARTVTPTQLDPAVRQGLREALQDRFAGPFEELKQEFGDISEEKLPEITDALLLKMGLAHQAEDGTITGWRGRRVDNRAGYLANAKAETVDIGTFKSKPTWAGFQKLMVHEVGIHTQRAENGKEFGRMVQLGLAGASEFEEGLGVLSEEVWAGGEESLGRDHYRYVIGAYAAGALDGQRHGKDETFQFAVQLKSAELMAKRLDGNKEPDVAAVTASARKIMFEHVYRAFRGMPEGEVMLKDLTYKASKADVVRFSNDFEGSPEELLAYLLRGKFNPMDATQRRYIEERAAAA